MLTHYPERKVTSTDLYSCEICGKVFIGQATFKRHMRIHVRQKLAENDEPQQCPICNKMITYNFKKHVKNHETEKTFKCELCEASFKSAYAIKVHMARHTGQKDYCCNVCQKQFTTSSNLSCHLRIHSGEKRYAVPSWIRVEIIAVC